MTSNRLKTSFSFVSQPLELHASLSQPQSSSMPVASMSALDKNLRPIDFEYAALTAVPWM
jgi:thiamine kinase-like enzyme